MSLRFLPIFLLECTFSGVLLDFYWHVLGREGHLVYPSKDFDKFGNKNSMKHGKRGPPLIFSQPPILLSKEFENDCTSFFYFEKSWFEPGLVSCLAFNLSVEVDRIQKLLFSSTWPVRTAENESRLRLNFESVPESKDKFRTSFGVIGRLGSSGNLVSWIINK